MAEQLELNSPEMQRRINALRSLYRVQHLAHHQFVNDPERDPDLTQMAASGHRFRFPMTRAGFLWACVAKQLLWPPEPPGATSRGWPLRQVEPLPVVKQG